MLDLVARHGGFDLRLKARGDLDVDQHHTVEDVGIALGEGIHTALGNKRGICARVISSCRWMKPWLSPRSISAAADSVL